MMTEILQSAEKMLVAGTKIAKLDKDNDLYGIFNLTLPFIVPTEASIKGEFFMVQIMAAPKKKGWLYSKGHMVIQKHGENYYMINREILRLYVEKRIQDNGYKYLKENEDFQEDYMLKNDKGEVFGMLKLETLVGLADFRI